MGVGLFALLRKKGESYVFDSDQKLWADILPTLDSNGFLDHVIPKAEPEFLISGFGYTAHQENKKACLVKAQVADIEKTIRVTGDRLWIGARPTEPEPFDRLELTWGNAFGGSKHAQNPRGKGLDNIAVGDTSAVPLPNIEAPTDTVEQRDSRPDAIGYGPITLDHPMKQAQVGTHSEEWLKYDFPGFLPDMDPGIFNMASADQQWTGRNEIPLGESYRIWNMHPTLPCWEGVIPVLRARCFVLMQDNPTETIFREVENMRATTLWLLPEQDSIMLFFHGSIPIKDDEAEDVLTIIGAIEADGEVKAQEYYHQIMLLRSDRKTVMDHFLKDEELLPAAMLGPTEDENFTVEPNQLIKRLELFGATQKKEAQEKLQAMGVDPETVIPEFVGPHENPMEIDNARLDQKVQDMVSDMKRQLGDQADTADEYGKQITAVLNALDADDDNLDTIPKIPISGPPDLSHIDLMEQSARDGKNQFSAYPDAQMTPRDIEQLKDKTRKSYLYTAQYQLTAAKLSPDKNEEVKSDVLRRYAKNKDLSGMDLTGADFSDMTLDGADFSDSFLESASFSNASLRDADFSQAVLVRAVFDGATLENALFDQTNMAQVQLRNCRFKSCTFRETNLEQLNAEKTEFENCTFEQLISDRWMLDQVVLRACHMTACILQEIELKQCRSEKCNYQKVAFVETIWDECKDLGSEMTNVSFSECELRRCEFRQSILINLLIEDDCLLQQNRFINSLLKECTFIGLTMDGTQFSDTNMNDSDFSNAKARNCNFDGVSARDTLFLKADLRGSSFREANLIQASLERAILIDCDFESATLFRTNVSKVETSAKTSLSNAYMDELEIYPMYRDRLNAKSLFSHE